MRKVTVQCLLCKKECKLAEGQRGDCRVRMNLGGKLQTLVYGRPCAVHVDPIEKKPIFHMLPGSGAFSIATAGCNLHCKFCQNWQISQVEPEDVDNIELMPEDVVKWARREGCRSIAYTYSEPTIFYEYMLDTAALAREAGIKNVWVTAGFINPDPLRELCKYIDAANIDLKGFTEDYYKNICFGELQPVLETLKTSIERGMWVEVTNLIVPTLNDDMGKIREMCLWIKRELGEDVPLHFSRFYPMYQLTNLPMTPERTLNEARAIALDVGLNYVYIGNVPGSPGNNTYCPTDGKLLIERMGFWVIQNNIVGGKCRFCGREIPGIWD
ncbi:MAG: AmmeMemoRadiSam system radical SAM enzyme [bacterium]